MKSSEQENSVWKFAMSGQYIFGRGAVEQVGSVIKRLGSQRPLIVTDSILCSLGFADRVRSSTQEHCVATTIFDGGTPEPALEVVLDAVKVGRDNQCDAIIGLGGGSNMDVAKMAAIILQHGGEPSDYFGFDRVPGSPLPIVAIPTTAGTGSEVSHSSVLTDTANQIKVSALSPLLRPSYAIVDPSLTDSCPTTVTAHSGIDALVHAIEAYTARSFKDMVGVDPESRAYEGAHPFGQMIAAEAIRLIGTSLVRVVKNGDDQEARDSMAFAASLAGMAFSNCGVALVHALEYPIGAAVHCSHGEGNGLLLPHVMRYNLSNRIDSFIDIAGWLGHEANDNETREQQAQAAISKVVQLLEQIGIRPNLADLGVEANQLPDFANKSFGIKRLMDLNPRVPSQDDLQTILQSAM